MKRLPLRNLSGPPFRSSFPALLEHEAQVLTRSVAQLLMMSIVWPLGYLLLLGSGVSGLAALGRDATAFQEQLAFIVPGVIAMQAIGPFSTMMYRFQGERQWGLLALKLVHGITPAQYVAGMCLVPVLEFLVRSLVVMLGAALLGVPVAPGEALSYPVPGMAAALSWACSGGVLVYLIRRQPTRMAVVQLLTLPLVFAAPVFYPLASMPGYLRTIALANPLTYQVELLRGGGTPGLSLSLTVTSTFLLLSTVLLTRLVAHAEPVPGMDHT